MKYTLNKTYFKKVKEFDYIEDEYITQVQPISTYTITFDSLKDAKKELEIEVQAVLDNSDANVYITRINDLKCECRSVYSDGNIYSDGSCIEEYILSLNIIED